MIAAFGGIVPGFAHRRVEPGHLGMRMIECEILHRLKQFQVGPLRVQIKPWVLSRSAMATAIMMQAASLLMPRSARESLNTTAARSAR